MKLKRFSILEIVIKGFIVGSSMSVPGVSGGTMALILGIYDRLIYSIAHVLDDTKKNLLFLFWFLLGSGIGIGSLAFVIKWLLETFPLIISFFFIGAVLGGLPYLFSKANVYSLSLKTVLFVLIGMFSVIFIRFLPVNTLNFNINQWITSVLLLILIGIVLALALILPGISTSHILLVVGLYSPLLTAITQMDLIFLVLISVSTLGGVFIITRPMEWLMIQFPHETYLLIIGFVIGSTMDIIGDIMIPAIPSVVTFEWIIMIGFSSLLCLILGYTSVYALSKMNQE